jgi:hypothetical protein
MRPVVKAPNIVAARLIVIDALRERASTFYGRARLHPHPRHPAPLVRRSSTPQPF